MFIASPPPIWQWVGIGAGFLALGVAILTLPTVLQMLYGKPNITLEIDIEEREGGRILRCCIFNLPVTNKWLNKLGVERKTAQSIVASFRIEEKGTKREIPTGDVPYIIQYDGTKNAQRVNLSSSIFPAKFAIAKAIYQDGKVEVWDNPQEIPPGAYIACVGVTWKQTVIKEEKHFVVSGKHPYIYLG